MTRPPQRQSPRFRALPAVILFAAGLLGIAGQAHGQGSYPVYAYWSFDADTVRGDTVRDLGPHGFDGKIGSAGGPKVQFTEGVCGDAVSFAQGNRSWIKITHPERRPFSLKPPFTIMAWAQPKARGQRELISQKGDTWDEGIRFAFSNQRLRATYSDGDQSISVQPRVKPDTSGHWALVALVHDGRSVSIYLNGEPLVTEPAPARMKPSERTAIIGNYPGAPNGYADAYPFIGLIDELVVFDAALTNEQMIRFAERRLGRGH